MPQSSNRIAYYRDRCTPPLTQAGLARALGKHVNSIQLWEKQGVPSPADLLRLAALFVGRGAITDEPTALGFWETGGRGRVPFAVPPELPQLFATAAVAQLLPTDALPAYTPLPPGSLLPLRRNPLFVGRAGDLRALAAALVAGDTAVITGMGGLGKTQLAAEFAHRYGQFFGGGVFWLNFDNPDVVSTELARCGDLGAMELRADFSSLPLDTQVALVQAAWRSPLPCLLVFDNCEEQALLARWRPSSGGCRVLVTSRRARWEAALGVSTLGLKVLDRAESITLLHSYRRDLPEDSAQLDAVAEALGDLPLALHLAGSFLDRYRDVISPAAYLAQMRGVPTLAHQSLQGNQYSPTGHQQNVLRTFALSYERLQTSDPVDRLAHDLLLRAACFAPGVPIPRHLLLATLRRATDEHMALVQAEDAVARLVGDLGLLELGDAGAPRMHRLLVAFVAAVGGDIAARADVEQLMLATANRMNEDRLPAEMLSLRVHLQAVTDTASARGDAGAADLCEALGWQLVLLSAFDAAEFYLQQSLTIREQLFGELHPSIASSLNMLGLCHQFRGEFVLARPLYERALGIWQQTLGPDHPETGSAHNNLGYLLMHLEALDAAQIHLRQALLICRRRVGIRHASTARILNNLGYVQLHRGKRSAARRYLKLALAIRRQVLPANHSSTAQTLNNLGEIFLAQGDYLGARRYHEQALAMRYAVFGERHYDVAESYRHLGKLALDAGDATEAWRLFQLALDMCTETVGPTSNDTALAHQALAEAALALEQPELALSHFQQALVVFESHYVPGATPLRKLQARMAEVERGLRAAG